MVQRFPFRLGNVAKFQNVAPREPVALVLLEGVECDHIVVGDEIDRVPVQGCEMISLEIRVHGEFPVRGVDGIRHEPLARTEVEGGEFTVEIVAQPRCDVDRRTRRQDAPQHSVALFESQLPQRIVTSVDALEGVGSRQTDQRSRAVVRPRVVSARVPARLSPLVLNDGRTAVTAHVDERPRNAVVATNHQHRHVAHRQRAIRAIRWKVAAETEQQGGLPEQLLALALPFLYRGVVRNRFTKDIAGMVGCLVLDVGKQPLGQRGHFAVQPIVDP